MHGTSYGKLLDAGFKIFRMSIVNKSITQCVGFGRWNRFKIYRTQAEAKAAWDELMKDPKNIGD